MKNSVTFDVWQFLLSVAIVAAPSLATGKTFSDSTFNLGDYAHSTYQTGGGTVDVSQTTSDGNPGSALVVTTDAPATHSFYSAAVYFVGNTFSWNPASDGILKSVSWSQDVYLTNTPTQTTSISGDILIFQAGSYYVNFSGLPTNTGVFQTATGSDLTQNGFSLVTDLATATTDSSVHPDFTAPLAFGFLSGANQFAANSDHTVVRVDNLSIEATSEALSADFNSDGRVNAADYVYWRKFFGDPVRYDLWRRNFGVNVAPGLGISMQMMTVPEPTTCGLAVLGLLGSLAAKLAARNRDWLSALN